MQFRAVEECGRDERLEFKAARDSYSPDKLTKYLVALANEGGGHLALGVNDKLPRQVCGTQAYHLSLGGGPLD